MTRPHHRRDQHVRYASVLTGLRCERDLAQKLCDFAREHVRADPHMPASRANPGNVVEAVRYLLRRGLGSTDEHANHVEVVAHKKNVGLPGLVLDAETNKRLLAHAKALGLKQTGTVRHLLRVGLGFDAQDSFDREGRFAAIAAAKFEVMAS